MGDNLQNEESLYVNLLQALNAINYLISIEKNGSKVKAYNKAKKCLLAIAYPGVLHISKIEDAPQLVDE